MSELYKEFGDVRYEQQPHIAFEQWWHTLVDGEARGAYLFAEPLLEKGMRLVEDLDDAKDAIDDPTQALISIPLNVTRLKLMKMVKRRIEAIHQGKQGVEARSLKSSKARYIPHTAARQETLKRQLRVYMQRRDWEQEGKVFDNARVAVELKLAVKTSTIDRSGGYVGEMSAVEYNRAVSNKISKLNSQAKSIIKNVGKGVFP
jgi:hypothetical protein